MDTGATPMDAGYVRGAPSPILQPPAMTSGALGWLRQNLFSGPVSSLFTMLTAAFFVWIAPGLVRWFFTDAVWTASDGEACRAPGAGACWAYIGQKMSFFMYGSYPRESVWRVDVTLVLGAALIVWLLLPRAGAKQIGALMFFVAYPVLAFVLLHGWEAAGLQRIDTDLWGGVFVSLVVAAVGIVVSLPGGVLLALGRQSRLPIVRAASVGFIEIVRGVPLITVLFMANFMLPLFVPDNWAPDRLLRPLIGVSLFASAYMAEVVRGGLQAMPKGQFEGAMALGLGYGRMMRLVVLPQALTKVIPGIVNTFIGLFKDTTLVAIVGIYDFLRTVDTARLDPAWAGPGISTTGYVFAAMFYFVFCFGMSRYSLHAERELSKDRQR
jgi:general L-amino acid transport system permease protein